MSAHFRLIYEELTAKRLKFILYDSFSHTWDVGANPNGRLFAPKTGHVLRHHFAGYRSLKFGSFFIDKAVFRLDFLFGLFRFDSSAHAQNFAFFPPSALYTLCIYTLILNNFYSSNKNACLKHALF